LSAIHQQLESWLAAVLPDFAQPISLTLIASGRSNFTYEARNASGRRVAVRRPPMGAREFSAHDVEREGKILQALEAGPVPVPRVVAIGSESEAGVPVLVMEFVGGETILDCAHGERLDGPARESVGPCLIEALAALHGLDVVATKLDGLRRPGGLVERQLRRWRSQLELADELTTAVLLEVHSELARRVPAPQGEALVHGDYKLANVRVDVYGALVAVLDWELAAIGDPLVDLGWLIASWAPPEDERAWITEPPTAAGGFASRQTLVDHYRAATGFDLDELDYYVAFANWRWCCINEGILRRINSGVMLGKAIDPDVVRAQILWQASEAFALLDGSKPLSGILAG
jgi:aminoglycoside phosphotransferase (APT) family kinase protein